MKKLDGKQLNDQIINCMMNIGRLLRHNMTIDDSVVQLTMLQLETLLFLSRNKQIPMNQVAEAFHITKPTATSMLNKLVNQKLVIRKSDKKDRRIVSVQLTPLGQTLVRKGMQKKNEKVKLLLASLSEHDKIDLLRIMNIIVEKAQMSYEK